MFGSELMLGLTPAQRVLIDRYPRPLEPEDPTLWLSLKKARERDDVITGQYDRALKWLKSYGFSAEPGAPDRDAFERALACDFPALLPIARSSTGEDRYRSRFWSEEAKTISLHEAMQVNGNSQLDGSATRNCLHGDRSYDGIDDLGNSISTPTSKTWNVYVARFLSRLPRYRLRSAAPYRTRNPR